MKVQLGWLEGVYFEGEGEKHRIRIEGSPAAGGRNRAMRPMQALLVALASCSAYDVVIILKKGRQEFHSCVVEVVGERADKVPAVFTKIRLHFRFSGVGLDKARIERAVTLAVDKYCSVAKMLRDGGVKIMHSCSID